MGVAHFSFNLRPRDQRCHRIYNKNIYRSAANQHFRDFKCLLAGIRLGNKQFIGVHAKLFGIMNIEGVFRIHKSGDTTSFLRFCSNMQRKGRLP